MFSRPERRTVPRHPCPVVGSNPVVATVGLSQRAAFLCDVSPRGVGIVTTHSLAVGGVAPVWLAPKAGSPSRQALGRVIHCAALSPDLHRAGLAVLDSTGEALFTELLAEVSA